MTTLEQGITKCEWCLHESDNEDLQCTQCGGPIAVLEPWVLQCGWCGSSNRRDLRTNCQSCGGELPHIPGTPRLPEPPIVPRTLPHGYEKRVRYWRNVHFMIGAIFMLFFFTIIFPIVGFFLLRYGLKRGESQIIALKNGVPTKGEITKVYIDNSQKINNVHPVRIDYTFNTPEGEHEGFVNVWDRQNLKRPIGEHLWVVFNKVDKDQNNIWPPLR